MWRLLEARLRPQLPMLAAMVVAGLVAGLALILRVSALRATPERLACVFGLATLIAVSIHRGAMVAKERRESRLTLLATLPVPLKRVALSQILESVAAPLSVAAVALAAGALGRAAVGGPEEPFALRILGIVSCSFLAVDQLLMLGDQLSAHLAGRLPGLMVRSCLFSVGCGIVGFGVWTGRRPILDALDALRPIIVSGVSMAVALAIVAALAVANHQLFVRRPDFFE